ncbi:MAG: hypothetical protein ACPH4G_09165 [Henriciella sp.]
MTRPALAGSADVTTPAHYNGKTEQDKLLIKRWRPGPQHRFLDAIIS